MKLRLITLAIVFTALTWVVKGASADDEIDSLQQQFAKLAEAISTAQDDYDQIVENKQALLQKFSVVEKEIKGLKKDESDLKQEIAGTAKDISDLQKQLDGLLQKRDMLSKTAKQRIRSFYMTSAESFASTGILLRTSATEIDRTSIYLGKIREHDQRLIKEIQDVAESARQRSAKLKSLQGDQEAFKVRLGQKREVLEKKVADGHALVDAVKEQESKAATALKLLRTEADRVESLLESLTGGSSESEKVSEPDREIPETPQTPPPKLSTEPFNGRGLFAPGLSCRPPTGGKLVQRFGKIKVPGVKLEIQSKGYEYSAPPESPVTAVAIGKVLFVGEVPSAGQVVIVDHGQRTYTLYGRLSEISVNPGDVLESGTVVGKAAAAPTATGGTVYFEVRRNGIPVNPEQILRK